MNPVLALALTPKTSGAAGFLGAIRGAARRVTWRSVAATLAIAVVLNAWLMVELALGTASDSPAPEEYLAGAIATTLTTICFMFTTLVADERVLRGAGRVPAYLVAILLGSGAGALLQVLLDHGMHLPSRFPIPAFSFFEYMIWGSLIVFIYVNRRSAMRATSHMNAAQVQRGGRPAEHARVEVAGTAGARRTAVPVQHAGPGAGVV